MTKSLKLRFAFLCCNLIASLLLSAQNTDSTQVESVRVTAYWIKNDDALYRTRFETYTIKDSITIDSSENVMLCTLKIEDSTATNYVLEAELKIDPSYKSKTEIDIDKFENANLLCGKELKARYTTNEFGVAEKIDNWEELQETVRTMHKVAETAALDFAQKKRKLDSKEKELFRSKLKDLMYSDDFVKKFLFGSILNLTRYHGGEYTLDSLIEYRDTITETRLVSGKELNLSFTWVCEAHLSIDSSNVLKIEEIRDLDIESYIEDFADTVEKSDLTPEQKSTRTEIVEGLKAANMTRQISFRYFVDLYSGWTLYAREKDYVEQFGSTKITIQSAEMLSDDERKELEKK